jgi:hypothetical protein
MRSVKVKQTARALKRTYGKRAKKVAGGLIGRAKSKRQRERFIGARKALGNPAPSKSLSLMRTAFTDAAKSADVRLKQARISYAQGVNDGLRSCGVITVHQSKLYIDGLRALLR